MDDIAIYRADKVVVFLLAKCIRSHQLVLLFQILVLLQGILVTLENRLQPFWLWGSFLLGVPKTIHCCWHCCRCAIGCCCGFVLDYCDLSPLNSFLIRSWGLLVRYLHDFSVKISVSQKYFILTPTILPIARKRIQSHHSLLKLLQLTQVIVPDFQMLFFWRYVLKTPVQRPVVFFHHVSRHYCTCPWLAMQRVDQTAFALLHCFLDEVKNCVYCIVFLVKNLRVNRKVRFVIFPSSWLINTGYRTFPISWGWLWRRCWWRGWLYCWWWILCPWLRKRYFSGELISHEETVFDFDGAENEFVVGLGVFEVVWLHNKILMIKCKW